MAIKRIETYSNYREFLKDYYVQAKKENKYFSYRYFCQKAGISSPTLYKDVAEGKRNLTSTTIKAFIKGLKLGEIDGRFFEALVKFNQAKTPSDKKTYLEQMRGLLPEIKVKVVPISFYAYYSNWYHILIRELACLVEWKEDYEVLAKIAKPNITKKQVKESVELLLELGFLKKKGGKYLQSDPHIETGSEVASAAVRNVNQQFAKLGMESVDLFTPDQRDVSSLTMGISHNSYQLCKREIQDFKKRIKRIVDEDTGSDRVFNLNVQLFPLSKRLNNDESEEK